MGRHLLAACGGCRSATRWSATCAAAGLFLGVELVRTARPSSRRREQAAYVVNRLRERGVLAGTDGPHHNVLKLRPPLVFSEEDADLLLETLDAVLEEDGARAQRSR